LLQLGMKMRILWIPVLTGLFLLSVNSCTKTVTGPKETDTLHDTLRDTLHIHDTLGPALLRFVSMFPDSAATLITIATSPTSQAVYQATNVVQSLYFPVPANSAQWYYLSIPGTQFSDSVPLPPLTATSITTYALFLDPFDGRIKFTRGDDSAKSKLAPPGMCYLRFINGLPDYPTSGPLLYVDLDSVGKSVFKAGTVSIPYAWQEVSPYAVVPIGNHQVYLRNPSTSEIVAQKGVNFAEGGYYTAHVTGKKTTNSLNFEIDAE